MIRRAFPDLTQLKAYIQKATSYGKGWPSVVLHTEAQGIYRPNIQGTFSLFTNLSGESHCRVDGKTWVVPEDCFFLSNQTQTYTLEIEASAETFNIHYGRELLQTAYASLISTPKQLLENPVGNGTFDFHNQLYYKDTTLQQLLQNFAAYSQTTFHNLPAEITVSPASLYFEEQLYTILLHLLQLKSEIHDNIDHLPSLKKATQQEIYRQLSRAMDYMYTHYQTSISLEALAQEACLSKFYYLRLFKLFYGLTPHQRIMQLRIEKAKELLKKTTLTITEIAYQVGFEYLSSLSRLFNKMVGVSPQKYRSS
ncbi:MAG: helix-turn-helix domain-containing protein [Thermonemataceae bacterium]